MHSLNGIIHRDHKLLDGVLFTLKGNGSQQPVRLGVTVISFNLGSSNTVCLYCESIVRSKLKLTVACAKDLLFGAENDAKLIFMTVNKGIGREKLFVGGKVIPNYRIGRSAEIVSLSICKLIIGSFAVYGILNTADIDLAKNTAVAGSKGDGDHCDSGIVGQNHDINVAYVGISIYPIGETVRVKCLDEEGHRINATHLKYRGGIQKSVYRCPLNTVYKVKLCASGKFFIVKQCVTACHRRRIVLRMLCCRGGDDSAEGNAVYVLRLTGSKFISYEYDLVVVLSCAKCLECHSALVTVDITPNLLTAVVSVIVGIFNIETEAFIRLNRKLYLVACTCSIMLILLHLSPSIVFVNVPKVICGGEPSRTGIAYL